MWMSIEGGLLNLKPVQISKNYCFSDIIFTRGRGIMPTAEWTELSGLKQTHWKRNETDNELSLTFVILLWSYLQGREEGFSLSYIQVTFIWMYMFTFLYCMLTLFLYDIVDIEYEEKGFSKKLMRFNIFFSLCEIWYKWLINRTRGVYWDKCIEVISKRINIRQVLMRC